jgi:streptogramin lyase
MIERRNFLSLATVGAAAAAASGAVSAAASAQTPSRGVQPDLSSVPTRRIERVDVLYATPHEHPNGLDATDEGLWIIDQQFENFVSIVEPATGRVIREFRADEHVQSASSIHVDDDNVMWIASTYNRLIIAGDPTTGRTLRKYTTPGAGRIYDKAGDAPGRRSPLQRAHPPRQVPSAPAASRTGPRWGEVLLPEPDGPAGTGAHSILTKGNLLYVAVPPARSIFVIDKTTWVVQDEWRTPGNRPHGGCWADDDKRYLLSSDTNLNAFYRYDVETGEIVERIQLPDDSPTIHGAARIGGDMYFCDDMGWMCRFSL